MLFEWNPLQQGSVLQLRDWAASGELGVFRYARGLDVAFPLRVNYAGITRPDLPYYLSFAIPFDPLYLVSSC